MAPAYRRSLERIKKLHPDQKALIVSGFAETDEVKKAQELGAGQYLKKPLTLEMIGLALKRVGKESPEVGRVAPINAASLLITTNQGG